MKFTAASLALILMLAACQPNAQPTEVLPTRAVLPSGATETMTAPAPIQAQTAEATAQTTAESTIETTAEATEATAEASVEPSVTPLPTDTLAPTQAAVATSTEKALEAPVYLAFTAAPPGTLVPTSNYHRVADVTINEAQFQKAVDAALPSKPSIASATVDFVAGAIKVKMTTSGASPLSGTVTMPVTLQNDLASITISDITTDPMPPPQAYTDVATGDLFVLMVNTLDSIVKSRIGAEQKLKTIAVTDSAIEVNMLVP